VTLQAPRPAVFGDFKRPHYLAPRTQALQPFVFSFTVKPAKAAAEHSPFTVLARLGPPQGPGRRVKAASHDYPLRTFEFDEGDFRGCELLCSPETDRGFKKRVKVSASRYAATPSVSLRAAASRRSAPSSEVSAVPFTLRNLKEDLEDVGSNFDGPPSASRPAIASRTAIRTPGPEGLEILVIGAPNLGEDPREDVEGKRDWWTD
jgi:hypothetical protein